MKTIDQIREHYRDQDLKPVRLQMPTALLGHPAIASPTKFQILAFIYGHYGPDRGAVPVAAIAQELYLDSRTVSRAIASLIEDHFIEKREDGSLWPREDDLENYVQSVFAE